jgi:hypothetical protein
MIFTLQILIFLESEYFPGQIHPVNPVIFKKFEKDFGISYYKLIEFPYLEIQHHWHQLSLPKGTPAGCFGRNKME